MSSGSLAGTGRRLTIWGDGQDGTVFASIEDETGNVRIIIWPDLCAKCRRELGSQVVEVTGRVSKWDGTTKVIATHLRSRYAGFLVAGRD